MILPFSTQINGKPTFFVTKIWNGIAHLYSDYSKSGIPIFKYPKEYRDCLAQGYLSMYVQKPKIHTIREDEKNRWKPGVMIDFFINCRQKDMFKFAPKLPVTSTQSIIIKRWGTRPKIYINDNPFPLTDEQVLELAQNDGFDNVKDFFEYFNKDFKGKIIHWTDFKY
jgi:hypothetical protein